MDSFNTALYESISVFALLRLVKDYITTWEAWLDVQNGADVRGLETYENDPGYRFMTTPRDVATYVHFDALYG